MISAKGGGHTERILFGKYQICRVIGQGRSGTVFLAKHLGLDEYRAVKRVAKEGGCDFSGEALVLKSLRHPGIPIIYDLEEDQDYYYLIEEYLDGESLFSLLERQGNLTRAKVISHGIELCQIMVYLHSLQPYPILYLDLQPKNLLICGGALKLIDFDQAVSAALAGRMKKRYGTAGCAAPEQFTDEPLDIRTDIYAIGALLYYMGTGAFPGGDQSVSDEVLGGELTAVIRQCIRPAREERYGSADLLLKELRRLSTGVFNTNQISLLKFAVVSSSHGMGATHVSLGLSSYLSLRGVDNLYLEEHEPGIMRASAEYLGQKPDESGIWRLKDWELRPKYGQCVRLKLPERRAVILDFGTDLEAAQREEGCELLLLICGGKWWEVPDSQKAFDALTGGGRFHIVFNFLFSGERPIPIPKNLRCPCYRLPCFCDPAALNQEAVCFFDELLAGTGVFVNQERKQKKKKWAERSWDAICPGKKKQKTCRVGKEPR